MNLGLMYHKLSRESGKESVFQITYIALDFATICCKITDELTHSRSFVRAQIIHDHNLIFGVYNSPLYEATLRPLRCHLF